MSVAAKLAQAAASLQRGQTERAQTLCAEVLREQPAHADALHMLGIAALQRGEIAAGSLLLHKSIEANSGNALAHCNLGNALRDLKQPEMALESYRRAIALMPNFSGARYGEGNALMDLGRMAEALASFERAIELSPGHAEAHNNRGNALLALGRANEALDSYLRTLKLRPDFAPALANCARLLAEFNRLEEALAVYDRLLTQKPADAEILVARGIVRRRLKRHAQALEDFERALALEPGSIDTLYRKAEALRDLERYRAAASAFAEVLRLDPARDFALGNLIHTRLQICDWTDYAQNVELAAHAVAEGRRVYFPAPFFSVSASAEAQLRCARNFAARTIRAAPAPKWRGERYDHERIRVAYVSADFREHPVSMLLVGVLEHHDRRRFEIIGISLNTAQTSPLGQRVKNAFDRFIEVGGMTDADAAALMRELQIDIAVDLMGLSGGARPGIFSHRPAPVQVGYLGYPGTTASPDLDYLIADAVVVPPEDRCHYTEQVVYLPDSYQPSDDERAIAAATPSRADCGLPDDAFVFCCFNTHYKIAPPVFDAWMRVLAATAQSVLWLSAGTPDAMDNLRAAASARGLAPGRLIFAPRLARADEHLARYRVADLFLDTLPFNAHATASDALWAGLPVLTCMGGSFASRVAASLLTAAGMPELIAANLQDYEARAVELASNAAQLRALREQLRVRRKTHALFQTARYCAHLEMAYSLMRDKTDRRESPAPFAVLSS